ncbi:TetR family transcriptional regulator [Streptomyces sp. NPDC002073]
MQKRSDQTRQALVRAAAELIANGRFADAGLVNICRRAGVSRGALYHHFSSTAELMAEVYAQAQARTAVLAEQAFAGAGAEAPARFSIALGAAMREEYLVRAGMQVGPDGTDGPPRLRDELLALVHDRVTRGAPGAAEPADLAGLSDLGELSDLGGLSDLGEIGAHREIGELAEPADLADLADLAVVVTAGLESLGYTDSTWWDPKTTGRIWDTLRPLFAAADQN